MQLTAHESDVTSLCWANKRHLLASGSRDQSVRIWDERATEYQRINRPTPITGVAWSPDEKTLAIADQGGQISFRDVEARRTRSVKLRHHGRLSLPLWNCYGDAVFVFAQDGIVMCLSIHSRVPVSETNTGLATEFAAFDQRGERFALVGGFSGIHVRDFAFKPIAFLERERHRFRQVCFSHDGALLAAQSFDEGVHVWETDTWKHCQHFPTPRFRARGTSMAFDPQGRCFALLRERKQSIQLWNSAMEESDPPHSPLNVFISYRREDEKHIYRVRKFAEKLRLHGLRIVLHAFLLDEMPGGPNEGWDTWSSEQALNADFVLVVGTASWFRCFDNTQTRGTGYGAACEAADIRHRIYEAAGIVNNIRIVYFDEADVAYVPGKLKRYHRFHADRDVENIVRWARGS